MAQVLQSWHSLVPVRLGRLAQVARWADWYEIILMDNTLTMAASGDVETGHGNNANPEKTNQEKSPFARPWKEYPGGYPMIAERIALKPQTAIYRRFDALNARHLLYLQAELSIMEKKLHDVEEEDHVKNLGYAINYQRLLERDDGRGNIQLSLVKAMHKKLNEYSEWLTGDGIDWWH